MVVVSVLMGFPTVSCSPFGALISWALQKTYKITKNLAFHHKKTSLKKAKNPYFLVMTMPFASDAAKCNKIPYLGSCIPLFERSIVRLFDCSSIRFSTHSSRVRERNTRHGPCAVVGWGNYSRLSMMPFLIMNTLWSGRVSSRRYLNTTLQLAGESFTTLYCCMILSACGVMSFHQALMRVALSL